MYFEVCVCVCVCVLLKPLQVLVSRSDTAVELLGLAQDGVLLVIVMFGEVELVVLS